jgi:hypothetical protein
MFSAGNGRRRLGLQGHLREDELLAGKLIVSVSRHMVAVIDGVLHDMHDCSRDGSRCAYGFFSKVVSTEQ